MITLNQKKSLNELLFHFILFDWTMDILTEKETLLIHIDKVCWNVENSMVSVKNSPLHGIILKTGEAHHFVLNGVCGFKISGSMVDDLKFSSNLFASGNIVEINNINFKVSI